MTNTRKAYRLVKLLREIGLPLPWALWIAKKVFPPAEDRTIVIVEGEIF